MMLKHDHHILAADVAVYRKGMYGAGMKLFSNHQLKIVYLVAAVNSSKSY
jgi:hypothetical protein